MPLKHRTSIEYLAAGSPDEYKLAESPPGLAGKVVSYVRAQLGPRLDRDAWRVRLQICSTCEKRVEKNGKYYCDSCGCPKWRPAELHRKARLANAPCPLGKWPAAAADSTPE